MPNFTQVLPWLAVGLLICALIVLFRKYCKLYDDLELLRRLHTEEKSAHYQTHRMLMRRERKLGVLLKQVDGMAEIAQSSAQLAQIYTSMMAEVRDADSQPMPLDSGPAPL